MVALALAKPADPFDWGQRFAGDVSRLFKLEGGDECTIWVNKHETQLTRRKEWLEARLDTGVRNPSAVRWELANIQYWYMCAQWERENPPQPIRSTDEGALILGPIKPTRWETSGELLSQLIHDERELPASLRTPFFAAAIHAAADERGWREAQPLLLVLTTEGTPKEAAEAHLRLGLGQFEPSPSQELVRERLPHIEAAVDGELSRHHRRFAFSVLGYYRHLVGASPAAILDAMAHLRGTDSGLLFPSVVVPALAALAQSQARPTQEVAFEWLAPATSKERAAILEAVERSEASPSP